MPATTTARPPRYMDMDPADLRNAYADWSLLLRNASEARLASSVFRCTRQIDLIVNVARKRGVAL